MKTIFEYKSTPSTTYIPKLDVPIKENALPAELTREDLMLPELNEIDLIRHYTSLSKRNFGVDNGFYPLGSCTMKYNPKINEDMARLSGFASSHPYTSEEHVQGNLELMYNLQEQLLEVTGMDAITLQPATGAQGELTGLMMIKEYFKNKGEERTKIITPDSSHGTNPATANMCSYETITLKSDARGQVDSEDLKEHLTKDVAAIMLTVPNTLGIFEEDILEITKLCHENGTLVYMDGANMNALVGQVKPKDMGVDVLHLNLHKTFSTPHGGGGPGAGPVAVVKELEPFLPVPNVAKVGDTFKLEYDRPKTIGRLKSFYGNFGILVRAYTYISALGAEGLRRISENAVLNANYMQERLKKHFHLQYNRLCKHEFVIDDSDVPNDVKTTDIAKRLIDYGFHPPTIHFPLIVHGAMMVEPTETENKETLDKFISAMIKIKEEAKRDPEILKTAPHSTPVSRLDDVQAARKPILKFIPREKEKTTSVNVEEEKKDIPKSEQDKITLVP